MRTDEMYDMIRGLDDEQIEQLLTFIAWPKGPVQFEYGGGRWAEKVSGRVPYMLLAEIADRPVNVRQVRMAFIGVER